MGRLEVLAPHAVKYLHRELKDNERSTCYLAAMFGMTMRELDEYVEQIPMYGPLPEELKPTSSKQPRTSVQRERTSITVSEVPKRERVKEFSKERE